ncbi:MAG TPA: hypothetical protein VHA53_06900 [Nitrolancea sp.]|nr:hypothetical protein [Nitrolancea sp.]
MVRRGVRWAALLALVASLFAGFAVSTSAASPIYVRAGGDDVQCNGQVDVDWSSGVEPNCAVETLAQAVTLADTGGVVQVGDGTFPGAVTINKALTLQGAQAGVDARSRTGSESVIGTVSIGASNVTVDGFTFDGSLLQVNTPDASILSGVVLQNNIFKNFPSVGLPTFAAGDILIQRNYFENAAANSEAIQIKSDAAHLGGCNGSQILDNAFLSATNNGGADVNFSCTESSSSSITVANNTSNSNSGGSSFVAFSGVTDGISVTGNSGTTSGSAIFFFGAVSGTADISGNAFVNGGGSAVSIHGADYSSDPVNTGTFNITGNRFAANADGISVAAGALGTGGQVQAHFNEITVTGANAVSNSTSTTIDATNNWWGCNTGPNTTGCGATAGPVTTDPWLTLTISADPSTIAPLGYPNSSSAIDASLTINSNGDDTSAIGHVYDGTPVTFATTNGTLVTTDAVTTNGVASTLLTATDTPDSATVSATLDAQTVSTTVNWEIPAPTVGAHVNVVNIGRPLLRVTAIGTPNGARGGMFFLGSDRTVIFGIRLTNVVVVGNEATITGNGIVRTSWGVRTVTFRINLTASDTSTGGTFEIHLSNGYDSGVIPVSVVDF